MSKLKVGDKVHVYGQSRTGALDPMYDEVRYGEVVGNCGGRWYNVNIKDGKYKHGTYTFHEVQCRRLKTPRPLVRFYVNEYDVGFNEARWGTREEAEAHAAVGYIRTVEFVEVRRKKAAK